MNLNRFVNSCPDRIQFKNWRDMPICYWDVETTGIDFSSPDFRILQICGKIFIGDKEVDSINLFIKPDVDIPEGASKVHKIYAEDVKDCPSMENVIESIMSFILQAEIWCAFNHTFDTNALISECERVGREFYGRATIDPLIWEREIRKSFGKNKQSDVAQRRGCSLAAIKGKSSDRKFLHDAETDVLVLQKILSNMGESLPYTIGRLISKQNEIQIRQESYLDQKYNKKNKEKA
jgi:DNA polymerase III alpha subunit (gram-positive type)